MKVLASLILLTAAAHAQQPGWTIIGWRIAVQSHTFRSTFFEAAAQSAAAGVKAVEGYSGQKVSPEISRNLDWNLAESDVAVVRQKLRASGVAMPGFHAAAFPPDEPQARKLF